MDSKASLLNRFQFIEIKSIHMMIKYLKNLEMFNYAMITIKNIKLLKTLASISMILPTLCLKNKKNSLNNNFYLKFFLFKNILILINHKKLLNNTPNMNLKELKFNYLILIIIIYFLLN